MNKCWLLKFKGDRNQKIYKHQEVHHVNLVKDNIPGYHIALDALLLEVTMPEDTMCILYNTQNNESEQCKKIMGDYLWAQEHETVDPSYAYLRGQVEKHVSIRWKEIIKKHRLDYSRRRTSFRRVRTKGRQVFRRHWQC